MESAFARLATDAKYISLAAEGRSLFAEGVDDMLYQSVYDGSDEDGATAQYVSVVQAVCATGNYERAMVSGVEIAQKAEAATGRPTTFLANVTGNYGGGGWLAGYENLAAFEQAQRKLNSDAAFVKFLDANTGCYAPDPSVTQSLLFARVG